MQKYETESLKELHKALAMLQTEEEVAAFLEDVCTIKEVLDMSQRLSAAKMLNAGVNYQTIAKEVGISTATISRVSRCIQYGSGGYKIVLDRLQETEEAK